MNRLFHEQEFDDETKLKLRIFRGYVREWVSVFMTDSPSHRDVTSLNVFDFFAGPGSDKVSNPGSPLIIQNEIRNYCETRSSLKSNRPIRMYFNDKDAGKIEVLQSQITERQCEHGCCKSEFSKKPFAEALEIFMPVIAHRNSANLVIMDQFGISDVTPDVVKRLATCSRTDILFFFPSSFMHRFREQPAFKTKYDLNGEDLDYQTIHRDICDYFQAKLEDRNYHLAPFSIKKNANIHGVIFGSSNLYGLEKFLSVCWKLDPETGDANYNMEGDPFRGETPTLFPELRTFRKIGQFKADLVAYIRENRPDNLGMYRYCLEKGFPPSKASESLKDLEESGQIAVTPIGGQKVHKGTFYLGHKYHKESISKIRFLIREGAP